MVTAPGNTMSTHTLRLKADAAGMKAGLDAVDKELGDVVRQMNNVQAASAKVATATGRMASGMTPMARNTKLARSQMQNFGYQLQDTVVQLEMGTHWTRVFAQQGSQVLGVFGAWPAILSAVGAAIVTVAYQMGVFSSEATKYAEAAAEGARETERLNEQIDELTSGYSKEESGYMGVLADAMVNLDRATSAYNEALANTADNAAAAALIVKEEWVGAQQEAVDVAKENLDAFREAQAEIIRIVQVTKEQADAERLVGEQLQEILRAEEARLALIPIMNGYLAVQAAHYKIIRSEAVATKNEMIAAYNVYAKTRSDPLASGLTPEQRAANAYAQYGRTRSMAPENPVGYKDPTSSGGGGGSGIDQAAEALAKFNEELRQSQQYATSVGESLAGAMGDFTDSLVDGSLNFKEFARSVLQDLAKIYLRTLATAALFKAMGWSMGNPTSLFQLGMNQGLGVPINPNIDTSTLTPFASGGIVNSPTLFPMSSGTGLMGEAGAEAIMPLSRNSKGDLGVSGPAITINNYSGQEVSVDRSESMITIAVGRAVKAVETKFTQSMASGQGAFARSMESGYSARRKAV